MKKSLGDKRRELLRRHIAEITRIHQEFADADPKVSKVFPNHHFGFQKVTVERPKEGTDLDKKGKADPRPGAAGHRNVPLPAVGTTHGCRTRPTGWPTRRIEPTVEEYIETEVLPWVPDAWVDHAKTKIGYEIPFTREFYVYVPPRPLEEIDADIEGLESEILALLEEISE